MSDNFYKTNPLCPDCASPMEFHDNCKVHGGTHYYCTAANCGKMVWPTTEPDLIAEIKHLKQQLASAHREGWEQCHAEALAKSIYTSSYGNIKNMTYKEG